MEFLITESQLRTIITESEKSSFTENMKILYSFVNSLVGKVRRKYDLNLKLLTTWGTSVGGLVLPLDNFIQNGEFNLDDNQSALILIGVLAILYYDNKSVFKKVLTKIKNEGLEKPFEIVLNKGKELKNAFLEFLSSLDLSIRSVSELISYSFLIPIIVDIQKYIQGSENIENSVTTIVDRLVASGVVLVAYELLHEVVRKISNRLK